MKEVLLITTQGCESCDIQDDILTKVYNTISPKNPHLEYHILDTQRVSKNLLSEYDITDFPTILFMVDNVVKKVIRGTASKTTILETLKELSMID